MAHEGAAGTAEECAAAAGRVYDKLHAQLAPLVGVAGAQALFARSVKLARADHAIEPLVVLDSSTKLREHLQTQDPAAGAAAAAALFGTFLGLITTFIGERLTVEALRSAWPMIEATTPATETKK